MSRRHNTIVQLDGSADNEETDEKYSNTEHYWMKGWLGICYHVFLDANRIIESSDLSNEEKDKEKTRLLEARKNALGSNYYRYPPWSRK